MAGFWNLVTIAIREKSRPSIKKSLVSTVYERFQSFHLVFSGQSSLPIGRQKEICDFQIEAITKKVQTAFLDNLNP